MIKTAGWFSSLVILPTLITEPGEYVTRSGERVIVSKISTGHDFGCEGHYENGVLESWHKSGHIFFGQECDNNIVSKA